MTLRELTVPDDCKVFTPAALADAMAAALRNRPGDRWLEPCVGGGAFVVALSKCGVFPNQITAVDLDQHNGVADLCGSYHYGVDFLAWSLGTTERFDRVIGNPPYLPLHRVPKQVRRAALRVPRLGGGYVPPKANCWYAFLCASLRLLRRGGGLCLVLPSAWEYADYAVDLRQRLPGLFARCEVFRSETSFFNKVLDGCVVLVADGFGQPNTVLRRYDFPSLEGVIGQLRLPNRVSLTVTGTLPPAPKPISLQDHGLIRFGDIARVRIGAVTGDAGYFLLTEPERTKSELPLSHVRPVLTRARHLFASSIDRDHWNSLRDAGERVWLFWPPARPGRRPKAVAAYLRAGKVAGCQLRQKVRARTPWFRTLIPPQADGFMSGMTTAGPWLSLNRMKGLTATNTLYTVHFRERLTLCNKAAWALALLSLTAAAQYAQIGRRYSDGLLKFEPKDVMSLMIPTPVNTGVDAIAVYQSVIDKLLHGDVICARSMAETFVRQGATPRSSEQPLPSTPD
jgi:adenine-specific DNA-methyltransferase